MCSLMGQAQRAARPSTLCKLAVALGVKPPDLSDDDLLARLLALNLARAGSPAAIGAGGDR